MCVSKSQFVPVIFKHLVIIIIIINDEKIKITQLTRNKTLRTETLKMNNYVFEMVDDLTVLGIKSKWQ